MNFTYTRVPECTQTTEHVCSETIPEEDEDWRKDLTTIDSSYETVIRVEAEIFKDQFIQIVHEFFGEEDVG